MRAKKLFALSALIFFTSSITASVSFYGKLNFSYENEDSAEESNTDFVNNASRIGIKGNFKLNDKYSLIFQAENEIDPTDGKADGEKVFKERNTFVGIKGDFGKLYAGTYDSALKLGQLKVDLFNDTRADIKYILQGENRMNSFVGYETPELIEGMKVSLNSISQSSGDFYSYSITYKTENINSALSVDKDAKGFDSTRLALMFAVYNFDIGLLLQNSKKISTNKKDEGHIFSINRKLSDKSSIYFQNAKSDMKIDDGEQRSFGYTYKINDKTKIFIHQSSRESSNKGKVDYISVGTEYKF